MQHSKVKKRLCLNWIIHQPLLGYKFEDKLHLGVREQKLRDTMKNCTTGISHIIFCSKSAGRPGLCSLLSLISGLPSNRQSQMLRQRPCLLFAVNKTAAAAADAERLWRAAQGCRKLSSCYWSRPSQHFPSTAPLRNTDHVTSFPAASILWRETLHMNTDMNTHACVTGKGRAGAKK
jgi:hypothetical protein